MMRHISSYHLEELLRIAFDIDKHNHCPSCSSRMRSVGFHSAGCPPTSITIEMECLACRQRYRPFAGYRAIMKNNVNVELEIF